MKRYEGKRRWSICTVTVDGQPLNPRLDLKNHSPDGFEWGYGGSGAAQLSLAILADHLPDTQQALDFYHRFKWAAIAQFPRRKWSLTSNEIDQWLHIMREREALPGGGL